MSRGWAAIVAALVLAAACGGDHGDQRLAVSTSTTGTSTTTTTTAPTTTAAPAPTTTTTAARSATTTQPSTTVVPAAARIPAGQSFAPFATTGGLVLLHPSDRVERIGFHESNNDGAQPLQPLATTVSPTIMESRERDTNAATAADIVVKPGTRIRAPITGTVKRGGHYTLYCDYRDEYVVIAPDAHPTWEVKLLHLVGLDVRKGEHVTAGQTVVADHAHQLPFESQVDELATVAPPWPHVHIEVVDPSIPDRPTPGGCG